MKGFELDLELQICVVKVLLRGTITLINGPRASGPIKVFLKESSSMALRYGIELQPPVPNSRGEVDVMQRHLKVVIDGEEQSLQVIPKDQDGSFPQPEDIVVPQETQVRLELRDVDDAGNIQDPPTILEFNADTEAPKGTESIGVMFKGEEPDEVPPEEPTT